ncbi:inverse autotransporter beta domain-containing protein [Pseudomonas sp. NPDC086251]|uniref:inverse autotransporter beta domain-containing protein n=1 Tax=Pseudomonas sp. NPDC086251 TaxID=3364431 RepID=UPI003834EA26
MALRYNRSERELARFNGQLMSSAAVARLTTGDRLVAPAPLAGVSEAEDPELDTQVAQTLSATAQNLDAQSGRSTGDALTQMAASRAGNALSQQAEDLLVHYGRAKIGVSTNTESHDVDVEFDYLHPLLERPEDILFLQVGGRTFDSRSLGNLGLGYRHQLNDNLMLGTNAFIDQDLSRDHTRAGVGLEAWTNDVRLAANAYAPLSDWKRSDEQQLNSDPEHFDLYERPASGWDARGEILVPGVPQLAATLKYFQWSGDGVDVFGGGELEKDPNGYAVGLRWQSIPLLGVNAEHQQIQGGDSQWQVGLSLNWCFDLSLSSQLDAQRAIALQPLASERKDFVQREYNVVLD